MPAKTGIQAGLPLLLSCDQESNQRSLYRPVPRIVRPAPRHSLNQNMQNVYDAMTASSGLKLAPLHLKADPTHIPSPQRGGKPQGRERLGRISAAAWQKLALKMFCLRVPGFVVKTFRQLGLRLRSSGAALVLFVAFSSKRKRKKLFSTSVNS